MSHDDAVKFIVERRATHFDPAVVEAFVDVAPRFKMVSAESRRLTQSGQHGPEASS